MTTQEAIPYVFQCDCGRSAFLLEVEEVRAGRESFMVITLIRCKTCSRVYKVNAIYTPDGVQGRPILQRQ